MKEDLINKIKKIKINKRKSLFLAATAMLIPSLFRDKSISFKLPKEITAEIVVIGNDTILAKNFYEKVNYSYETKNWYYPDEKGNNLNVSLLFDYKLINNSTLKKLNETPLKNFDAVTLVTYKDKYVDVLNKNNEQNISLDRIFQFFDKQFGKKDFSDFVDMKKTEKNDKEKIQNKEFSLIVKNKKEILYNLTSNSENLGAKAFFMPHNNSITMVDLKADPKLPQEKRKKLQDLLDAKFNREDVFFNYDHEFQHHLNAKEGINQLGMSPEQMYLRKCHDELSANLKAFWKQREAYLKNGNDITKLPSRSVFYHKLVKEGKITPKYGEKISENELKLITEGMQKVWIEEQMTTYGNSHLSHISNLIKNNPAYETPEGTKEYYKILNNIYSYEVNGQKINTFPYVKEFIIPFNDRRTLENLKNERGFIENDAISYIKTTKGKKALNDYIGSQKLKYMKEKLKTRN